jgi:hypothetical protein
LPAHALVALCVEAEAEAVVLAVEVVTGAVPLMLLKLRFTQQVRANRRNTPPVGVVSTRMGYFVLEANPHAVSWPQSLLTTGYCTVPELPIVINTGILIVAVDGIVCVVTMQYCVSSRYEPAGILIIRFVPETVIEEVNTIRGQTLHTLLQAIIKSS